MPGLLVLNGGDEFKPGNDPQDRELVACARPGPALVVPTAAARQKPEMAVETARRWFANLGVEVEALPVYTRRDAASPELVARAAAAGFLYLTGGDPGLVARVLARSRVWEAMLGAWEAGAGLAGSSAGAMVLGEHTLVMARWPHHHERRAAAGLGLVPGVAVVPHFERFGPRWTVDGLAAGTTLLGIDERSAASWDGTRWRALGAGGVTVTTPSGRAHFQAGQECSGIPDPDPAAARASLRSSAE
ncbi:MAG: Type 1 glutamine amidotransferase-like domain-containing protein [Candidatus Dormibacteraeota bacterium]|nr:Type 1 glutamine amidotransferase-like domain-containing protein [Candidatus Dormibacteraeota bacterium]